VIFLGGKMKKKICLVLVLSILAAGAVFSQSDFKDMGKNTITIDLGPTLEGLIFGGIGEALAEFTGVSGFNSWGFGFAAQYERQLFKSLSVAGRFIYLGGGLGFRDGTEALGIDIQSIGIEGHARFYPGGKTFFLDGMLGYANLMVNFSGEFESRPVNKEVSRGFFTVGGKLGWRIKFGSGKIGFTFEPSIGYIYGISKDDSIWTQVVKKTGYDDLENAKMEEVFSLWVQDIIFIGGPRIGLAVGLRF
jgi:hypothetical protein